MSETKPCMNTECANYKFGHDGDGTNCKELSKYDLPYCPKYRDTPPPKPFTPKNPDDYLPGCRNPNCVETKTDGLFHCLFADWYENACDMGKECHSALCKRVPCYDPAPKPKTQKYAVVRYPENTWRKICVTINGDINMCPDDLEISTTAKQLGITCKIIEEIIEND